MKRKSFVLINLMISLALLFVLVGGVVGNGLFDYQSVVAAQYRAVPEIAGVEPASAPNDVDATITISGFNFEETPRVYLGDTELVDVTWVNDTTLEAVVPRGWDPGVYDLTVENSLEEFDVLENAFTVLQEIWTVGEIEGGRIDEIVINPQNPDTLYASSFGIGLFRSRDAGEKWEFVFSNGLAVNVAIDPVDPNYLYLFGPWQLFRSADAGDTWDTLETDFPQHLDPPQDIPEFSCGADIKPYPHPTKRGTVFASVCGGGLIKSTDHGEIWKASMEGIDDLYITSLAFHPSDPNKMVVSTVYGNLYVSVDGGDFWKFVSKPMDNVYLVEFNPHSSDELWVLGDKLIKSTNSEFTQWEEVPPPPDESWSDEGNPNFHRLHFSPNVPGSVYIIMLGTGYKSIDGGKSWVEFGLDGLSFPHDFAESLEDDGAVAVYMGDRYFGIFKSTDDGVNWEQKIQGLTAAVPEYLSVSPEDPSVVYGSMQHTPGIYRGTVYGSIWQFLQDFERSFQSIAADPFTAGRVYDSDGIKICRSDDWGETWPESQCEELPVPEEYINLPNYVEALRAHPEREGVFLAGLRHWRDDEWFTGPGSIYYTTDGGENWYLAETPPDIQVVHDLAFDTVDPDFAYAGTSDGFYRSKDAGKTWVRMDIGLDEVGTIAVEPEHGSSPDHCIVAVGGEHGGRYRSVSTDQGETWTDLPTDEVNLENIHQVLFDPKKVSPSILYAAARTGLWHSYNCGQTWSRATGDLGFVNVIALEAVKEEDRVILYAATPGGYAARTDREMMTTTGLRTSDDTTLVNPGVYRFTQLPAENYYLPIIMH